MENEIYKSIYNNFLSCVYLNILSLVKEKEVVIDANHPLAGETLYFDVEIVSVRAATSEEIAAILAPRGGCGGGCGGCGGGCGDDCNCDDDCSCGGCGN